MSQAQRERAAVQMMQRRAAQGLAQLNAEGSMSLDFVNQLYKIWNGTMLGNAPLSDVVAFTRASAGWSFSAGGLLVQSAANAPRFDYDPITLAARGLLMEEQRTNAIRNNTMAGAVAGSPGTLPTNWNTAGLLGLTRTILGTVVEDGMACIDIRWQGTTGDTIGAFYPDNANAAAINGQSWAVSGFMRLIAGSLSGIGVKYGLYQHNSGGSFLGTVDGPLFTVPTTGTVGQAGQGTVRVTNRSDIGFVRHGTVFTYSSGLAVDFTLRIGLLLLEQAASVGSPIATAGVATTRAADSAISTVLSAVGINPASCTVIAEFIVPPLVSGKWPGLFQFDAGTSANRAGLFVNNTNGRLTFQPRTAGVDGPGLSYFPVLPAAGSFAKVAMRLSATDVAMSVNGAATSSIAYTPVPGLSRLVLGKFDDALGSCMRRLTILPTPGADAALPSLSI
ncbi:MULTISPECIES: phage head spike fiber domain-containing protein [unclassified Cupriavidus]